MLFALLLATSLGAAPVTVFDQPPATQEEARSRAEKLVQTILARLPVTRRAPVSAHLKSLEAAPSGPQGASMLSGFFGLAGYDDLALLHAAWAVARAPDNPLYVSNLAVMLLDAGGPDDAVAWLLYAQALAPRSPLVLTNLGVAAVDKDDWDRACTLFQRALAVDDKQTEALLGMASCYLHKGDVMRAAEMSVRANGVVFRKAEAKKLDPPGKGASPPPQPIEAPPPPGGSPDEEVGGTHHLVSSFEITFPPLPRYSGPEAFLASANSRDRFLKALDSRASQARKAGDAAIATAVAARQAELRRQEDLSLADRRKEAAQNEGKIAFADDQATWAMQKNTAWAAHELEKASKAFKDVSDAAFKEHTQAWKIDGDLPPECKTPDVRLCQNKLVSRCKRMRSSTLVLWAKWQDGYEQYHRSVTEILSRFYRVQGGWIRLINDRIKFEAANAQRMAFVYVQYAAPQQVEPIARTMFAALAVPTFSNSTERCPTEALPTPEEPPDQTPPELVAVANVPCPFEKRPLELTGTIPKTGLKASAELGCDHIKVGLGGGPFEGSVKRTFVKHTMDYHFASTLEKELGVVVTAKGTLTGTVDITRQADGTTTATSTVEAKGSVRVLGYEVFELHANIAADHILAVAPKR